MLPSVVLLQRSQVEDYGWCVHMYVRLYTVSYLCIILYHTVVLLFFIGVMVTAQGLGYVINLLSKH